MVMVMRRQCNGESRVTIGNTADRVESWSVFCCFLQTRGLKHTSTCIARARHVVSMHRWTDYFDRSRPIGGLDCGAWKKCPQASHLRRPSMVSRHAGPRFCWQFPFLVRRAYAPGSFTQQLPARDHVTCARRPACDLAAHACSVVRSASFFVSVGHGAGRRAGAPAMWTRGL